MLNYLKNLKKNQLNFIIKHHKNLGFKLKGVISKYKKLELINLVINNKLKIPSDLPEYIKPEINNEPLKKIGLKKFNEEEEEKYKEEQKYRNAFKTSKTIELQPHQFEFIKHFCLNDLKGALAFHGTGTGKTLTAVVTSNLYLSLYPDSKVIIISPSALLYNFVQGMIQFGLCPQDTRYNYYSYEKYIRNKELGDNSLVIIDEAHNLRTQIIVNEYENPDTKKQEVSISKNKRGYIIKTCASDKAKKVLLLTATPFVNNLYDIENLLSMIDQREPNLPSTFYTMCASDNLIYDYMKYRISHFEKSQTSEYFPERREKLIPLYLEDNDLNNYNRLLEEKSKAFFSGSRQLSNLFKEELNYKMVYVVEKIIKDDTTKNIVYTGFQDSGVKLLTRLLDNEDIGYKIISGDQNAKQKEEAKKYYNYCNYVGDIEKDDKKYFNCKYRVLIITKAGSEGVDTIATNNIFLIDPNWNEAVAEQIIARAIRYKSHHTLPKNKRYVNVYRLLLVKPSDKEIIDKINSPQFNDYEIICKEYKEDRKQLNKLNLQKKGGKITIKDATNIMNDDEIDKYKSLKTKEEREQYIKNLDFSRYKGKNDLINIFNSKVPSIDLYIFILSKSKQKIINDMIKKFDTFQSFEMEEYEVQTVNKLFDLYSKQYKKEIFIESDKKYLFDVETVRNNIIDDQDDKINNYINSKRYNDIQDKIKSTQIKKALKSKIKQYNQFFTNHKTVKDLIKFSSIENDKEYHLNILEPTAGYGAIVEGLLETGISMKIDMCEIDDDNREVLNKLVMKAPDILCLNETKDFLKYLPSIQYDYIFMNPPFHLKKNNYFKYDIYDIDFIIKAYPMLKIGGSIISITSTHFLRNKKHLEWLESHNFEYITKKIKWGGEKEGKLSEIPSIEIAFIKIDRIDDDEKIIIPDVFNDNLIDHGKAIEEATEEITDKSDYNEDE
jgi:hypothetical protein